MISEVLLNRNQERRMLIELGVSTRQCSGLEKLWPLLLIPPCKQCNLRSID